MSDFSSNDPPAIVGPYGNSLSVENLPPPDTKRWVVRRKAEVVAAVSGGLLGLEEACNRYSLSVEEFMSWRRAVEKHGIRGLRITRIQMYRNKQFAKEHRN